MTITTSPTTARSTPNTMPLPAALLGAAGALPFIVLVVAPYLNLEPFGFPPLKVLGLYAGIILAFMGAIHWGLAMAAAGRRDTTWQYIVSVLPALLGWFSLAFLPPPVALRVMAFAFATLLLYDLRAIRLGRAPVWYGRLRWPLTLIVVPCLLWASIRT